MLSLHTTTKYNYSELIPPCNKLVHKPNLKYEPSPHLCNYTPRWMNKCRLLVKKYTSLLSFSFLTSPSDEASQDKYNCIS